MVIEKSNKKLVALLILSFGILGFNALVFQVVFAKKLILLFGMTAPAIGTVLAVYFSGMALGSIILGRAADRISPSANNKLYTSFFVFTAIYGFSFPLIYKLLNWLILYVNSFQQLDFSGFNPFAFIFSMIFLILPSFFLGGGLSVLGKILISNKDAVGKKVSFLYFVDTFGSALGAGLTGYWFIPAFGFNLTLFIVSCLSMLTAVSLLIAFKKSGLYAGESSVVPARSIEPQGKQLKNKALLYALFFTGFLALALEVFFTKALILFIGSSTYAFSLILIVFLLGIMLGSATVSVFIDRIKLNYAYLGMILGLLGFWVFITMHTFEDVPFWYLRVLRVFRTYNFVTMTIAQIVPTCFLIFPSAFFMGIILPLSINLAKPDFSRLAEGIGKLYFANTFGGVIGSLAAGFIFMQYFGYQKTLVIIALSYFILGIIFILKERSIDLMVKIFLITFPVSFATACLLAPSWSQSILSFGVFQKTPYYMSLTDEEIRAKKQKNNIVFYKEGMSNVVVTTNGKDFAMRVNGKADASTFSQDLQTEIMCGALPMMLHPNPEDVLVIGLGSGISLGTVTQFDEPKRIDAIELDPAILEASHYFKDHNHDAVHDPRVKMILADARNFLYLTDKKYDVISSEPSNIWVSGNVNLFTKEFYELTKSRLNDDGIMLQWIHTYSLESSDIKAILKTFQQTFPQTYVFDSLSMGDILIIGSKKKESILDYNVVSQKFNNKKVRDELWRVYVSDPYELLACLLLDSEHVSEYSKDGEIHADDRPFMEFTASKSITKVKNDKSLKEISSLHNTMDPTKLISGGNKEELDRYFTFSKKLMELRLSYRQLGLINSIDTYNDAAQGVISNSSVEATLRKGCKSEYFEAKSKNDFDHIRVLNIKCDPLFNARVVR